MNPSFDLTGRRALITGGSGGLGRAIAQALYEAGAELALLARSESVIGAAQEIGANGRPVSAVRADLGNRAELTRGFGEAVNHLGGIDILVTAHGMVTPGDSVDYSLEVFDKTMGVNVASVFELCQLAGKRMLAQGKGKIINLASMLSFSGGYRVAAYAASKGAISQLTMALANEWSGKGVNVNAIAPGYIKTQMNPHVWKDPVRSEQILARIPAGRWGEPDDMKGAAVFLASPASDYVHGVILPVDGGWMSR